MGGARDQRGTANRDLEARLSRANEDSTNFTLPEYSHTFIHVKFARNSYEFCTNFVQISVNLFQLNANHTRVPQNLVVWGRGMVETCDKCLPHSTGLIPHTMPRPKEPFHLLGRRTQRRRLRELQQVVTKELAAPYTVKYLPDTGRIVLTPKTRVVVTFQSEPTMEERLIMAVRRIRALHFSRTESRYLVGSMTYGVVWDQVYGMLRQLALPESRAFTAYTGDDAAINGAAGYLPDRIGHLFKCGPPPPSDIMQLGDRRLHWLPMRWTVHRGMRLRTSIARLVAPPAPTNYLVGGY